MLLATLYTTGLSIWVVWAALHGSFFGEQASHYHQHAHREDDQWTENEFLYQIIAG